MEVKVKKLSEKAIMPTKGSASAAGYDLYAAKSVVIKPHKTWKIPTDIAMAIPEGYFGAIFARSGLATENGLRPANCVGVVDSDYRGNIIVALHNDSGAANLINQGDRIAQMVILEHNPFSLTEVDSLDDTERGEGGFGHTGK